MARPVVFSPEENERLRGVVRDLARRVGTKVRLADLLGCSSGMLSYFLSGQCGIGRQIAARIDDLNSDAGLARIHAINEARTLSTEDLLAILAERKER